MQRHRAPLCACAVAFMISGIISWTPAKAQQPCNPADEFWEAGSNFEYVYNASVEIEHTSAGRTSTAGFSFSCAVIINGEQPCFYSLKLSTCRLDDRTDHPDRAGRQHSFNRLLKRGHVHFRLAGGELDQLLADPEESAFVTNVRRGVLSVLRVNRPLLTRPAQSTVGDCERTVSRLPGGKVRVERSRGCDASENVPSALSFFSVLPSLHWVEDHFSVASGCDYETSGERVLSASCRQTWQLSQPTADHVQVIATQELGRFSERSADPPLEQNSKRVPVGLVMADSDPYIAVDDTSVYRRLRDLVAVSTPLMTPEAPRRFSQLLHALRTNYQNPLQMADNCTDCSTFEKYVMSELAQSAVLQCGSADCLRQLAAMLRADQVTPARLTTLFLTWHWHTVRDVQTAHMMYTLCELAPTRWCLLGLASVLRRSQGASTGGDGLEMIADRLRRYAIELAGDQCRGGDAKVLLALKTFSNMGELAFENGPVLSLVRTCMMDATRPVMISSEAVKTLSTAQLSPKFAKHFRTVMESEQYPLLTRQLAYLTLLRRFPTERTFRGALSWATATPADPLTGFILRHWKHWPLTAPHRDLMLRVADRQGVVLADVADDPFNSPSVSSLRELRLDRLLKMALPSVPQPAAGLALYRLHGASFLPHLLRLDTELSLGAGPLTPVQIELRAVGLERLAHDWARDPAFKPATARDMLGEVASALLAALGSRYGGDSFVTPSEAEREPGGLRLSPAVTAWLHKVLQTFQSQAALPDARPRAVLTLTVMGSQVAYLTAEEVIALLAMPDPTPLPYHILGEKVFHAQTLFKFVESQHRMALAVGLPLEVVADGSVAANAAAEISSRLGDSYRGMHELFNGDAQLSASAGVSLVLGLEVALPPFARAGLQLNSTLYAPFSLNVSYAIHNRTIHMTAPKPDYRRTLLLIRHGAQLRQGDELRPSPSAEFVHRQCVPQAIYTGLRVCRQFRHAGRVGLTAPLIYHVTGENPDPEFDTYVLDVWSSSRDDGYLHGGMLHVLLHRPAAAAHHIRLTVGFRLMPINFNPLIFRSGQRRNSTLDLRVGEFEAPVWHLHLMRAHEERDDVFYTETRGWLINEGITVTRADLEQVVSLPWVAGAGGDHRNEVYFDGVRMGDRLVYRRRYQVAPRTAADADFDAELRYRTQDTVEVGSDSIVYRNTLIERLLAPQFFTKEQDASVAWLKLNYTRRLTANDELTEIGWNHLATAATPAVTLSGLLNITSTADSSARLLANLTASDTDTGTALMYTAARADYRRHREGADVTDHLNASLTSPESAYSGGVRLDWLSNGRLLTNASLASASGWDGSLTAALEPASPGRRLTARLQLPLLETVTLESEFSSPVRPRPWLHWYLDEYAFSQSSRLWWSRYDVAVSSSLHLQNASDTLDVTADLGVAHAQNAPAASSAITLRWDKRAHLWDSMVALDTPVVVFNNTISSNVVGDGGMERHFRQTASSPYFYLIDHDVQGSVRTSCLACTTRQRDFDMKLAHKWMRLQTDASRNFTDHDAPGGQLHKFGLRLDSSAEFLPSLECRLKPDGNFDMSLTLPSAGFKPKLDIKYTKQEPGRRSKNKVVTRALDISIQPDPRGRSMPALHLSLETTPDDPTRFAAEFEAQPSLWLSMATGLAKKLQMTVAGAQRAVYSRLADKKYWLNELFRPITSTNTVLEFIPQIPYRLRLAGGWLLHRLAALVSPWHSVTTPVYQTLHNLYRTAVQLVMQATAGIRQRASDRALAAVPRELMSKLMRRLGQLQQEAWRRLPFQFQMTMVPPGRRRLEVTNLPDYANVETVWNLSAVVQERLSQPSPLTELLAASDDRRPLAALWSHGRALALDGHSFLVPATDGCRHLLLADVEQRSFSVLRSGRHLVMTFLDCNVVVNDRGQAHVDRFNVSLPDKFRTWVEADSGRLLVRSRFGLDAELDFGCGIAVFRLDAWMAPRTAGLLAPADHVRRSAAAAWRQFRLLDDHCPLLEPDMGPHLEVDACGSINTPECSMLKSLEADARQHRRTCDSPAPVPVQLTSSGPEGGPATVRVLLAVADPAVSADTVHQLTTALRRQLTELAQRNVQYALVADAATDRSVTWVDEPAALALEGHKLSADDLVDVLHAVMTQRPFGGPPAHRVLVVFAPADQLRGGASLTGLRRQLWSRRITLHLVTPLQQLRSRYQLPQQLQLHGLNWDGRLISGDSRRPLTLPEHQGDLGQLVVATSGVVWDSALLAADVADGSTATGVGGATSAELIADAIWQQTAANEPGAALPLSARMQAQAAAVTAQGEGSGSVRPAPPGVPLLLLLLLLLLSAAASALRL